MWWIYLTQELILIDDKERFKAQKLQGKNEIDNEVDNEVEERRRIFGWEDHVDIYYQYNVYTMHALPTLHAHSWHV